MDACDHFLTAVMAWADAAHDLFDLLEITIPGSDFGENRRQIEAVLDNLHDMIGKRRVIEATQYFTEVRIAVDEFMEAMVPNN